MEDSNSVNGVQYEDNMMISLLVLPSECLKGILSFCDANSLCALELTSRAFQQHTENVFASLAFEQFGLKSANKSSEQVEGSSSAGKTVWRQGLALVQTKQHYTVTLTHPAEYVCEPNRKELAFDGLATHPTSSFILYKTDNWGGGHFDALAGSNPVCVRNAATLSFDHCLPNPWIVWNAAVCGQPGCEIVVTNHRTQMMASRGYRKQELRLQAYDELWKEQQHSGIEMNGSEHCLIALYGDTIFVFRPTWQIDGDLLSFVTSVKFDNSQNLDSGHSLRHACPELPGVFGFVPCHNKVSMWQVCVDGDDPAGDANLKPVNLNLFETATTFGALAIGERYAAGSTDYEYDNNDKNFYVYARESGEQKHILREPDVPEDASDIFYGAYLEFVGDMLVTTSWFRSMLCIWDAKAGTLLRRYGTGQTSTRIATPINGHFAESHCMVRLCQTGSLAFLTTEGQELRLWSFPFDWRGDASTATLVKREKLMRKCRNAFDFDQDPAAFAVFH